MPTHSDHHSDFEAGRLALWGFGCVAILPLMLAAPLAAQDGSGCDKFAWSLVTVQAQFAAQNIATVSAGAELPSVPTKHS